MKVNGNSKRATAAEAAAVYAVPAVMILGGKWSEVLTLM
jgi:hypothetical protein